MDLLQSSNPSEDLKCSQFSQNISILIYFETDKCENYHGHRLEQLYIFKFSISAEQVNKGRFTAGRVAKKVCI